MKGIKRITLLFFIVVTALLFAACGDAKPDEEVLKMQDGLNSIALGNISTVKASFVIPRNTTIKHDLEITWSLECEDGTAALEKRGELWYVIITPTPYEEDEDGYPINEWGIAKLLATVSVGDKSKSREWEINVHPGDKSIAQAKAAYKANDPVSYGNVTVVHRVGGQGFFIDDGTAALYVYDLGKIDVKVGDLISIEGKIGTYGDAIQVVSPLVTVLFGDNPVGYDNAEVKTIEEIKALDGLNQANFFRLFNVEGYITKTMSGTSPRYYLEASDKRVLLHYSGMSKETETMLADYEEMYVSFCAYTFARNSQEITLSIIPQTLAEKPEPPLTYEQMANKIIAVLEARYKNQVYVSDVELITGGSYDSVILWESDKTDIISKQGKFTMPAEDTVVTLTATIKIGDNSDKSVTFKVTAKAVDFCSVKEVSTLIDGADLDYVRTAGIIIWREGNSYLLADETGFIVVEMAGNYDIGDKIELIGKGRVIDRTSTYVRKITEPYIVAYIDADAHTDPLIYEPAVIDDLDFTISAGELASKVPVELLFGTGITFEGYIRVENQSVYLADSLEEGAIMMEVLGQITSLRELNEVKVIIKGLVYKYSVANGWSLYFLNRDGDIEFDEGLSDETKINMAKGEIMAIVGEGSYVEGNLNFVMKSLDALLPEVYYIWTTNNLNVINASGKYTAPKIDTDVMITVKIYLSDDTSAEPNDVQVINVVAVAGGPKISEVRKAAEGESVTAIGVVSALLGNNAFIQDNTGGIYLFLADKTNFASQLVLGNLVEVSGKAASFNEAVQIADITEITVLATGKPIPAAVEFSGDFRLSELLEFAGSLVSIEGFRIMDLPPIPSTPDHYSVIVTNGKENLTLRVDKTNKENVYAALKQLFENMELYQEIKIVAAPVSQYYGNAQLMICDVSQVIGLPFSDTDKANYIFDELKNKYIGKTYEAGLTIRLDHSHPLGASITWESNNALVNASTGLVGDVTEETIVTLTVTVGVGSAVIKDYIDITVIPEIEVVLLYHFNFEEELSNRYSEPSESLLNRVDGSDFAILPHRSAANITSKVAGATNAMVIAPRQGDDDGISYVEFDFGTDIIRKISFDTYYWNEFAAPYFEKCVLQMKDGDDWVTVFDILDELKSTLTIHSVTAYGLEGSLFRFYAEGGKNSANDARLLVDNIMVYG